MSIDRLIDLMGSIEAPVLRLPESEAYFAQPSIPSFHFSEGDVSLDPLDTSDLQQGILNIDNPEIADSEPERLEYLYGQRQENEDTEDVLEHYEIPPVRLVCLTQRRFPIDIRCTSTLEIESGICLRHYQPLLIAYNNQEQRIIPRVEYPSDLFELFQPEFQFERPHYRQEEIKYSSFNIIFPSQDPVLLRHQNSNTFQLHLALHHKEEGLLSANSCPIEYFQANIRSLVQSRPESESPILAFRQRTNYRTAILDLFHNFQGDWLPYEIRRQAHMISDSEEENVMAQLE